MLLLNHEKPEQPQHAEKADELGIHYDGPVLTGKISLELAKEQEARRLVAKRIKDGNFARPQNYDPVLRAHCRFDKEG